MKVVLVNAAGNQTNIIIQTKTLSTYQNLVPLLLKAMQRIFCPFDALFDAEAETTLALGSREPDQHTLLPPLQPSRTGALLWEHQLQQIALPTMCPQ